MSTTSKYLLDILKSASHEDFETILAIGSACQSAKISKGSQLEKEIIKIFVDAGYSITTGKSIKVNFTEVSREYSSSQSTYQPDMIVETDTEILIIDSKSSGWNNNTPILETINKFIKTKLEVAHLNPEKEVRFILLKNTSLEYADNRAIECGKYGIEVLHANSFLTGIAGKPIDLDELTQDFLRDKIIQKFKSLVNL